MVSGGLVWRVLDMGGTFERRVPIRKARNQQVDGSTPGLVQESRMSHNIPKGSIHVLSGNSQQELLKTLEE